jgi:hypothetical protein
MNIAKTKCMSLGTDANHLELENGEVITGLLSLGTLDPYLPKKEETPKYSAQGNTSTENNSRIEWRLVVKRHNKTTGKRLCIAAWIEVT